MPVIRLRYHFLFYFHLPRLFFYGILNWMHHAPCAKLSSRALFFIFHMLSSLFGHFISAKKIKSNCLYIIQEIFILIWWKMELIQLLTEYTFQLAFFSILFKLNFYSTVRPAINWTLMIKKIWKCYDTLFINDIIRSTASNFSFIFGTFGN